MTWRTRLRRPCRRRQRRNHKSPASSMSNVQKLAFVGSPVTDMQRARSFYEDVLGLKVAEAMMGGQWVEYDLGNNTLAIANVGPQWTPADQGTGVALEVEDFDAAVKALKERKG